MMTNHGGAANNPITLGIDAIQVLLKNPVIRDFLDKHDPMAVKQAQHALVTLQTVGVQMLNVLEQTDTALATLNIGRDHGITPQAARACRESWGLINRVFSEIHRKPDGEYDSWSDHHRVVAEQIEQNAFR